MHMHPTATPTANLNINRAAILVDELDTAFLPNGNGNARQPDQPAEAAPNRGTGAKHPVTVSSVADESMQYWEAAGAKAAAGTLEAAAALAAAQAAGLGKQLGAAAAISGYSQTVPPIDRRVVVEIKAANALPLIKYACTDRVAALPTGPINAARVRVRIAVCGWTGG